MNYIPLMIKNGLRSIDRQFVDTRNQQTNNYQLYKQDRDELNNQFKQNANNLGYYQDRSIFQTNLTAKPVQNFKFKDNNMQQNYRMQNFMSLNGQFDNKEINKYYDNKPVDTRRDLYEDLRNEEEEKFIRYQGGPINKIVNNKGENTRSQKRLVNNYVPIKKNLAVPLEKIK